MATRHERRKRAKLKALSHTLRIAAQAAELRKQDIIRKNMSNPRRPERSGSLASHGARWEAAFSALGANGKVTRSTANAFVKKPKR